MLEARSRSAFKARERIRIHEGANDAAVGVSAYDEMADAQHLNRVFDGGRDAARGLSGARNDIAGVAADEEVAGLRLQNEIGHDSRVSAGDEENIGRLAVGEQMELVTANGEGLGQKSFVSLDQLLHFLGVAPLGTSSGRLIQAYRTGAAI